MVHQLIALVQIFMEKCEQIKGKHILKIANLKVFCKADYLAFFFLSAFGELFPEVIWFVTKQEWKSHF